VELPNPEVLITDLGFTEEMAVWNGRSKTYKRQSGAITTSQAEAALQMADWPNSYPASAGQIRSVCLSDTYQAAVDWDGLPPSTTYQRGQDPVDLDLTISPNPADQNIKATFTLPSMASVNLAIRDIAGQTMTSLLSQEQVLPGIHAFAIDVSTYPKGIYLVTVTAGAHSETKKLVVY
jgi:hypothetical protein